MATENDNLRGAGLMVCSMFLYTFNDACLKAVGETLPIFQSIFLRSILVAIIFSCLFFFTKSYTVKLNLNDFKLLSLRAIAEVTSTFFFFKFDIKIS